ncbi:MAG: FAD-binding protein [Rubrivivax sp.]|jgi:D-lactate dehydrogenase (cytochrome)|nr:FAD-binding protein [Rubrivivax sp.]
MNAPLPGQLMPELQLRPVPPALLQALTDRFGARCSTAAAVREQHGRDESPFPATPPEVVLFCESADDVQAAVRLAAEHRVPVIPFGVGSSLEGHLLAVQGGISLDVSRMNRVLHIHAEDLTATVEPGVTREQLNQEVRNLGLFFPIDPGANASLGGMAATRASGTNAVRYGTMRENVLGLQVVTAQGELIRTGTRARKSSAGYDLTRLMVGSEGTLGVITELTVRLYPLPEAVSAAVCHFDGVRGAVQAVMQIIQMGVPIARCELLDTNAVRAVNAQSKLGLRELPMLLMEFHGSPAGVQEQAKTVQDITGELGGQAFEWATTPEERSRLWTARHKAYFAGMQTNPGCRTVTTDTCVPISRLGELLMVSIQEADASGLPYYIVGHVGDGNFHLAYLVKDGDLAQRETAERLSMQMVRRAIALEGTCTGEHGIGLHKMGFLLEEAGDGSVAMMRQIKRALDPHNILNPGKIFSL